MAINIVTFTPFVYTSGQVLLDRHVEEHEQADENVTPNEKSKRAASVARVRERARGRRASALG